MERDPKKFIAQDAQSDSCSQESNQIISNKHQNSPSSNGMPNVHKKQSKMEECKVQLSMNIKESR